MKKASIKELYQYQIYRDGTATMNDYLYQHVDGTQKGKKSTVAGLMALILAKILLCDLVTTIT